MRCGVQAGAREDVRGDPAIQEGGEKERVWVQSEHVQQSESVTECDLGAVEAGDG